jgi:hypothetical protein
MEIKRSIKEKILLRLIAAAFGFLIGDVIIGGFIWCIYSLLTEHWGTSSPLRMSSGLITAAICFILGDKFLFPVMDYLDKKIVRRRGHHR